jgi:hypothetical protein
MAEVGDGSNERQGSRGQHPDLRKRARGQAGLSPCYVLRRESALRRAGRHRGHGSFSCPLGVLLGETAHDFRCCLDHLAWALYKRGRTPNLSERWERDVAFPIYGTREGFNKLPGVRRADRKIVRGYQPFRPGESRAHQHVFTVLQELSNEDKHRAIQRVVPITSQIQFSKFEAIDCIVRRAKPGGFGGRFEPGAELMRFYVKKTGPNPRIDGQPHFTLTPALHELLSLEEFLQRTMNATNLLLREFAEPPPSALALLGQPVPPRP